MDAAFLIAATPREHICLGCRLTPLTFGQWFLLNEYCPFFTDLEVGAAQPDLPTAVFICSRSHAEAAVALKKWWAPFLFRVWGYRVRRKYMRAEFESFLEYVRENQTGPVLSIPANARKSECGGPWVWRLYAQMRSTFCSSRIEALDTPIIEAICLDAAYNEHNGHVKLAHPNFRMLMQRRRERNQAAKQ